ncbi:bifunctional tRNA (5-methylaminomethyl-2-thiouridine)(34)-methyltransferase MnmD/FAD-dependent 5-carboxymethylaminomethyl-2-thiouridine(34) oxidoreductase MnmC [Pseudomonas aeruginosa]|uniref:bifunctional tRNA (5-methylaminomethyl-2-thiouridine)(34)-methyltransferase MnmD/FAD-dependent 5-carboxymethylaminomethyl-2-thiouridine(34) oxidoreductase MnmC n=1 Tax=Pseudomonas aeruginosa TaxID=287 RepID=UPI003905F851
MSDFQHAQLDWDENGQPLSRAFGDVYFSRHSGLNETRHVFLATNRLAERFAALGDGEVLCIGETGFGTGLNFLCAWQLFERVAPAGARLEFVSVEKFPLAAADLRRALALWPELAPWSEALLGQYLAVHPGFQRLAFAGGRVGLTLLLGDALECLPQLDARVDAWFLDGFAPAKNPDMWSPVLFAELARLSAPQATLGTFTSARHWWSAARGWQVTLIERHPGLAREASGNPQGVLYLKLSAHGTPLSRLVLSGFGHTRRLLERLRRGHDWDACGVLQLAFDAKEAQRQAQLAAAFPADLLHGLEREQAERLAGVALPAGGLFYPEAGWVHPPALCQALAATPGITLLSGRAVRLRREGDDWCAYAGDECLARAPLAILATAADIRDFPPAAELPLKRIRGQVTRLPATPQSRALRTVVCAEGYVAPPRGDEHTLGASFDFKSEDLAPTLAEHQGNLELLREISPDLLQRLGADDLPLERLEGRAAFRCTSPDYLPLVGPLAERAAFDEVYAVLARDARQVPERACPWLPGLYLNSGHGSRGLISAPLSGELLAAWICGEPLPLPRAVAEACHPNRFLLRDLVRGQRG